MAARALHPSELEIQREVEALRDLRRRSIAPGALTIDPDLPPNQSPPSPTASYWSGAPTHSNSDGDSSSSSHGDDSASRLDASHSAANTSDDSPAIPADDPFHLFWVPASLHPEIAPAEFRAFLKEHARAPPPSDDSATLGRSNTVSSTSSTSYSSGSGLGRRKSMLSRQYQPSENDGIEDEKIVPLRRNRSNLYANRGPQLTINDLQKLDELAEEASVSDDPSRFRNILRRSLSLNLSPSALYQMEEMPDMADEADAPIIVPPPGQILRRAARTKIRKPGLPGDGGGHRFGSTRRAQARAATMPSQEGRTSSDRSSSDHGDSIESVPLIPERIITSGDKLQQRPESYSEETQIYDAYVREEEEVPHPPVRVASPEDVIAELPDSTQVPIPAIAPQLPLPELQPPLLESLESVLHQPQPQPLSKVQPPELLEQEEPLRTPSPPSTTVPTTPVTPPAETASIPLQTLPPPSPVPNLQSPSPHQRKEKDKKGLFSKWGGDKGSKKAQKAVSSEKETSFFGSLFGGSKKKQDSEPSIMSSTGRETAQALLGASKSSKNYVPPTSPGLSPGIPPNNYSRYPIHVERAIYRLSHIKLANPRRPLYEQVLISNLMFWYLGVINKPQTQQPNGQPMAGATATTGGQMVGGAAARPNGLDQQDREQKEQREGTDKERLEKEQLEKEQRERAEREFEMKKKESGRRGSLTKTPPSGAPGGGRRAEMPIKGPQYEMQHRVMEQEYGNYAAQQSQHGMQLARPTSTPIPGGANNGPGQQYSRGQQPPTATSPNVVQPQPKSQIPNLVYYSSDQHQPQPKRMTPSPPQKDPLPSPPSGGRRSQSPPTPNAHQPVSSRYNPNTSQENFANSPNNRLPGRSLSATAIPSPPMHQANGRSRKGTSAYAAIPAHGKRPRSGDSQTDENSFEEEDVPLAVWQQQRRR
ncbi:hypothetical protein AX17_002641 [Amanita inopinata Kibby_2008]|nr:hypothetical protein AX17_002641 [Amanita inopinata Kibby_2008]